MTDMADPYLGLVSFQEAMSAGIIAPRQAKFDQGVLLFIDTPDENTRLTYALVEGGIVKAIVVFVPAEPYGGEARFSVGYAVADAFRGGHCNRIAHPKH